MVLSKTDPSKKLSSATSRAAEIFGSFDENSDGEISMDEFVDGYMSMHTMSNGKTRFSRKSSMFQSVTEKYLDKLRQKMDAAIITPNSKNVEVKVTKEDKPKNKEENPTKQEKNLTNE